MSGLRNAIVLAALGGGRVGEAIDTFAVAVRARAVAGERQRALTVIDAAIQGEMDLHQCSFDELPKANKRFVQGLRRAHERVAAGSVPVAGEPEIVAWAVRAADGMVYVPGDSPIQAGTKKQAERVAARNQGKGGIWSVVPLVAGSVPVATSEPMRFKDTLPIEVNEAAAVAYVRLSDAPVARTCEHVKDAVLVDYGRDGYPVGVEIHFAAPVATPTTPGRVTCRRCGYFVDSDAHERTCGRAATPTEPEWRATSSDRLLGRNPDRIERHSCGCVTGWDEVYEQCVLIRCGRHSAASPVPTEQPEER